MIFRKLIFVQFVGVLFFATGCMMNHEQTHHEHIEVTVLSFQR
ncbi:hypothetical protein [Evansella halocellulosilytica]|nr:hypothetical protein [Evansella halocellulosilytica]